MYKGKKGCTRGAVQVREGDLGGTRGIVWLGKVAQGCGMGWGGYVRVHKGVREI